MKVLTDNKYYGQIADVIREQNGTSNTYTPPQMVSALKDLFYEEVEGVPPITFQGIGENLLDYRIDGASGGVGDLITDSSDEKFGKYKVPVVCGGTTTNIYLDEPIDARANIPSEYEEVEYIESTGTQYINTGFKLNTNCRIVFDYYLTDLVSFSPFGSYQTQNQIGFTSYVTDNTSRFGTFVTRRLTGNYNNYQINNRAHFEYSKNGLYQNGSLVYSITTNDAVSNYNCFIFGRNADDVATGLGNIRLYYFKIYNNDSLVRNFIPCYRKSDNVAGLYDLVNSTFYTNEGTGNFIVGSIKENESISLSDTNVNIPTIRGTNVLSIDTTVQPSNVYVKSRHESSYETAMRERYEEAQAQLDALESEGE